MGSSTFWCAQPKTTTFFDVAPYRDNEKVEVGNPPELLEEVEEPEAEDGVLGAPDLIVTKHNLDIIYLDTVIINYL